MAFKVTEILSGNKIRIVPKWVWNGQNGHEVIVNGYKVSLDGLPFEFAQSLAKNRLISTIKDKEITLKNPIKIEEGVLYCDVYYNEINISKYFADFNKELH
jgi:hypothetical protein